MKSLTIGNCQISMQDLERLLSLTPSLVHLKLVAYNISRFDSMFDGSVWEKFIENNLLLLKEFKFFLTCDTNGSKNVDSFDSIIVSFQSSFWLTNKNWFVTYNYIPQRSKIWLYTTPTFMDIETRSSKFEVSSTNSKCQLIFNLNDDIFIFYMDYSDEVNQKFLFFIEEWL